MSQYLVQYVSQWYVCVQDKKIIKKNHMWHVFINLLFVLIFFSYGLKKKTRKQSKQENQVKRNNMHLNVFKGIKNIYF